MAGVKGRSGRRPEEFVWYDALRRALKRREEDDPKAVEKLADKLVQLAEAGDLGALKELADRLDGKARQQIVHDATPELSKLVVEWKQ